MYNPQNVHECEIEKTRHPRAIIDSFMTLIGIMASLSSVPQIIKIVQTQTVVGISLLTQLLALFAVICWFLYGLYIKNKPLAITSGLSAIVLATVVVLILMLQ